MTAAEFNPELRKLIDARLEAIDRMLTCAQIGFSERRSIVGEVETQIFELLARRCEIPKQEDVQAILDSLDPPESYIPEELRDRLDEGPAASKPPPQQWLQWPQRAVRLVIHFIPGVLCAVALLIVNGIVVMIIAATQGVIPWLVTLGGLAWLNYVGVRRFRSWWATRQGPLLAELRHSLGAWLLSNNGAQAT